MEGDASMRLFGQRLCRELLDDLDRVEVSAFDRQADLRQFDVDVERERLWVEHTEGSGRARGLEARSASLIDERVDAFLVITGKWDLRLGEYRGEYNSAWVGSLMASAATCMLAFFGFYLVKNSLSRDRRTRVGEILAATPLSGRLYIASKFVSNLAVLTSMAVLLAISAVVMQVLGPV